MDINNFQPISVATSPLGHKINFSLNRALIALQGESGSGKSSQLETILLRACESMGSSLQVAVIDGKRLSFMHMKKRLFVYTELDEWLRVLRAFNNEMNRRYIEMAEDCVDSYFVSPTTPFLLLVIDEANTVFAPTTWEKKVLRDEAMHLLEQYTAMCRQASMGIIISGQSLLSDCISTNTRSNLSTRFALRTSGPEQAKAINNGDSEACDPLLLDAGLPGDEFVRTDLTNSHWVRCRADCIPGFAQLTMLGGMEKDKCLPACLDFNNPDYVG